VPTGRGGIRAAQADSRINAATAGSSRITCRGPWPL
jgi:hypothetical protein